MQLPTDPADLFETPRGRMAAATMLGASIFTMFELLDAHGRHQRRKRAALDAAYEARQAIAVPQVEPLTIDVDLHLDQECARGPA